MTSRWDNYSPERKAEIMAQRRERRVAARARDPRATARESADRRASWSPEKREEEQRKARERYHRMRAEAPEQMAEFQRLRAVQKRERLTPAERMWNGAKARAARKGLAFDIEVSDITVPEFCPVLGIPLDFKARGQPRPGSPSLDRVDNTKGYVKGNVEVISYRANVLKSDASPDEVRRLMAYYERLGK